MEKQLLEFHEKHEHTILSETDDGYTFADAQGIVRYMSNEQAKRLVTQAKIAKAQEAEAKGK